MIMRDQNKCRDTDGPAYRKKPEQAHARAHKKTDGVQKRDLGIRVLDTYIAGRGGGGMTTKVTKTGRSSAKQAAGSGAIPRLLEKKSLIASGISRVVFIYENTL